MRDKFEKVLKEIKRVTKPGGRFLSISFDQPHFRKLLLQMDSVKDLWKSYKVVDVPAGMGYFMTVMDV